jgi:molybdenum cofactor cytidylyltransferase
MKMTAAIVLAAGSSSRLGKPKQLEKYQGTTLLRRTIKEIAGSKANGLVVVLGHGHGIMQDHISDLFINTVINYEWQKGMGSTIKCGLQYCRDFFNPDFVLITVCDQPFLTTSVYDSLIQSIQDSNLDFVLSRYENGAEGVPGIFKKSIFEELENLPDEAGFKSVLKSKSFNYGAIDFPGGHIDIDTEKDLRFLRD